MTNGPAETATLDAVGPVEPGRRIAALDVLRGVAVLGILALNVQSFSMIGPAYVNPTSTGELTGANRVVWLLTHVLGDQKFMTIFSLLFGAGIALMAERVEAAGRSAAGLHARRMAWLLLFGLLHAHLLWYGDILFAYAICGFAAYPLRRLPSWLLLTLGVGAIAIPSAFFLFTGWSMQFWPPEDVAAMMNDWSPPPEVAQEEIDAYRGGWLAQMTHRVPAALGFETFILLIWTFWRAGGLMLVGMVLYRAGVLTGRRSRSFYLAVAAGGLLAGLPLVVGGVRSNEAAGWTLEQSMFFGTQWNYWGSLLVSAAWIAVVMVAAGARWFAPAARVLAAVGRMALTNYLLETIIMTTIFYGHGLGLFGRVDRVGQIALVAAVWVVLLVVSPLWLHRFRYGPFEWLWRSLAYLRPQPLRRAGG